MGNHAPDPRTRNIWFDSGSAAAYLDGYGAALAAAWATIDADAVERVVELLRGIAAEGGVLYSAGNGGSAAIADHLTCDFTKGTMRDAAPSLRTQSLVSGVSLTTAIANDIGYDRIFAEQLGMLARPGDAILLISSSGSSANITAAIERARDLGITSIALTGFSGGSARAAADHSIHVAYDNYGVVEDAHQAVMHAISQYFYVTRAE